MARDYMYYDVAHFFLFHAATSNALIERGRELQRRLKEHSRPGPLPHIAVSIN